MRLKKRTQKSLMRLLLALLVIGVGMLSEHLNVQEKVVQLSPGTYQVTAFHDGDTIDVEMDGKKETIRFIGVDTPETHDPRKAVQCFGTSAANFTKQLIGDSPVRLEADPLSSNRDRYNRLLRYVYVPDGRLVQAEIIKQGYGFALTGFPHSKMEEFVDYQRTARELNNGLWGSCNPTESNGIYTSPNAE